ncbi:MAG: helix-turn-helix transcriptional regulator [Bermanella sp.]
MDDLLDSIKHSISKNRELPFTVYSSIKEQVLLNVPIIKPLLIIVLRGEKQLGENNELICNAGEFIFLSDRPSINMRNVPKNKEYFALIIEFEYQDFNGLQVREYSKKHYHVGTTEIVLKKCLLQFIESSLWAPEQLWTLRKREIIELLCYMGHNEILSMMGNYKVSHQVHDMFCNQGFNELTIDNICHQLAMSESTLRRKLKSEDTSVQEIKDLARWGLGLHLLQTTNFSIGLISEKCGYQSQSRFTDRFKGRFGLTPSQLRKTKMTG